MYIKSIFSIVLLAASLTSQAATLQNGDILTFTTDAGSYIEGAGAGGQVFDSASLDALNGLVIGAAQPGWPDIDQTWTSTGVSVMGNHRTSTAVTVIDDSTLDFTGWIMYSGADHAFGETQDIANYSYDGTNFSLDYYWNAITDNGGFALGGLGVTEYHLHLEGTVSSVPVPAAVWLFGSGLLGLVGMARRKQSV